MSHYVDKCALLLQLNSVTLVQHESMTPLQIVTLHGILWWRALEEFPCQGPGQLPSPEHWLMYAANDVSTSTYACLPNKMCTSIAVTHSFGMREHALHSSAHFLYTVRTVKVVYYQYIQHLASTVLILLVAIGECSVNLLQASSRALFFHRFSA